ncbi:UDPglucose 6-dehydrogenase [Arthrobacter stackebrandtii]|uniref:UDP-glucose 6-dehydrogenase n=1 Tax=Arthrobacter stackebrandtii TaxID=272161 RepID=A0ABS4YZ76_9MICC|nr:UDP-glucose/GDP-mannose dehydrogenase family protein [Arthrobacter stackebrandtii]MBP2414029.1 UDPglucose 6-dehydrogenase [Arthrobacter stackebrandtii]PYG99033.1 UDP-glucose 6-dehydrogenase [Arthrobacter stackebrandtii]
MRISVIGTGYLGATHAACLAEMGFEVIGMDTDPAKVAALAEGRLPFHEPALPELLRKHVQSGRLRFTTSMAETAAFANVHFLAVGTPQASEDGTADVSQIDGALRALLAHVDQDALVIGKSTVPVGTARRLASMAKKLARPGTTVELAWNPEFLREGYAVKDTLAPDRLVFGTDSGTGLPILRNVYATALAAGTPLVETDFETAELVKVAANAFLATKISFINAFAEITEVAGGDITTLADAIGMDERIGRRFLNAGVGFGGGCLPKDIRALQARTRELGLGNTMDFLASVDALNLRRRDKVVELVELALTGSGARPQVAILGASFKPESDDVRDSPALDVAARLHERGFAVSVFDPIARHSAAQRRPELDYPETIEGAVAGADAVVLLTEWRQFRELVPGDLDALVRRRNIIDGRNVLDAAQWLDGGWNFWQLGRKPADGCAAVPAAAAGLDALAVRA